MTDEQSKPPAGHEQTWSATWAETLQREVASRDQRIGELEAQLRAQAATLQELRAQLGAVRDSLEQRNGLIVRLEAEAASSSAALGGPAPGIGEEPVPSQGQPHCLLLPAGEVPAAPTLLGRRTAIGRTPDNELCIDADSISRHHAVVLCNGTICVIEDLDSTNGTFVNGERVSRCALRDGDLIGIGTARFRFLIKPASS